MRRRLLNAGIGRLESRLGVELDYLREMARAAPDAVPRLALFMPLAAYGHRVPAPALHLARLGATLVEDCGECAQIAVNLSVEDGVAPSVLAAALRGDREALPPDLSDAFAFGEASALRDHGALEPLRERLRERWGDAGVVELSVAVATAALYPVLKRAMGFSRSCAARGIQVPGAPGGGAGESGGAAAGGRSVPAGAG